MATQITKAQINAIATKMATISMPLYDLYAKASKFDSSVYERLQTLAYESLRKVNEVYGFYVVQISSVFSDVFLDDLDSKAKHVSKAQVKKFITNTLVNDVVVDKFTKQESRATINAMYKKLSAAVAHIKKTFEKFIKDYAKQTAQMQSTFTQVNALFAKYRKFYFDRVWTRKLQDTHFHDIRKIATQGIPWRMESAAKLKGKAFLLAMPNVWMPGNVRDTYELPKGDYYGWEALVSDFKQLGEQKILSLVDSKCKSVLNNLIKLRFGPSATYEKMASQAPTKQKQLDPEKVQKYAADMLKIKKQFLDAEVAALFKSFWNENDDIDYYGKPVAVVNLAKEISRIKEAAPKNSPLVSALFFMKPVSQVSLAKYLGSFMQSTIAQPWVGTTLAQKPVSAYKKLLSTLKTQVSMLKKAAEAPEGSPLGRVAFAPERSDVKIIEPNTSIERNLSSDLKNHFNDNNKLNTKSSALIKTLLQKGLYKQVFSNPKQSTVYRGMAVSEAWLRSALKLPASKKIPIFGRKATSFIYKPKNGKSSSWTVKKGIADNFATDNLRSNKKYNIVMYAKISQNKNTFIAPEGVYKLDFAHGYKNEHEAIGLGDIKVYRIDWDLNSYFDDDY